MQELLKFNKNGQWTLETLEKSRCFYRFENENGFGPFSDRKVYDNIKDFDSYYSKYEPLHDFDSKHLHHLYQAIDDPGDKKPPGYVGRHADGSHFKLKSDDPEGLLFGFKDQNQATSFFRPEDIKVLARLGYSLKKKNIHGDVIHGKNQIMVTKPKNPTS